MSKSEVTLGPASIDAQKQVPPGSAQFTATMKAPSRRLAYCGSGCRPPRKTRSWMAMPRSSQARTPMNANGCSGGSSGGSNRAPGGNRYFFHDCGPTTYPNSASSSRRLRR